MSTVYLYDTPGGKAARHLYEHSALANCATAEETWHAGDDCLAVTLDTPMPSSGERYLWDAIGALNDGGSIDFHRAKSSLDLGSFIALMEAVQLLGMAFSVDVEIAEMKAIAADAAARLGAS